MEETKRIYCGSAKAIPGGKGGIKLGINLSKLDKSFFTPDKNGDQWVNIDLWPAKENQYGNSHNVTQNTFKKEETKEKDSLGF